ncbi:hypothetical protein GGI07_004376 [Coemansia sp. Benny D115]|nr:hypothetical protein GGI07_004376 [Coemansia sp. Benny D115]
MNPRLIKGAVPVIHRLLVNPAPSYRPIISIRHYSKEWTKHEDEIHKIWPFESADIPTYTPQKFYSSKSILTTVVNYLVRLCTINFYWTMFSDEYMKSVDAKMVPLVLKRTAEAISDGSDEAIDSVMTEALAKDTKNSLADLRMQGLSVDVDVLDVESVKLVKKFIHMGKEEAFDSTTPYHIRRQHFDLLWTPAGEIASTSGNKANSNDEPKPSKSIFSASPGGLRLFMMFNATADIRLY